MVQENNGLINPKSHKHLQFTTSTSQPKNFKEVCLTNANRRTKK